MTSEDLLGSNVLRNIATHHAQEVFPVEDDAGEHQRAFRVAMRTGNAVLEALDIKGIRGIDLSAMQTDGIEILVWKESLEFGAILVRAKEKP